MDDPYGNLTIISNEDGTINIVDLNNSCVYTKCYPINVDEIIIDNNIILDDVFTNYD